MPTFSARYAKDRALVALGDTIRLARSTQGVAQEQLALLASLDRSYVGGVERGEANVTVLTLLKIASALGLNASDLLEQAGL